MPCDKTHESPKSFQVQYEHFYCYNCLKPFKILLKGTKLELLKKRDEK